MIMQWILICVNPTTHNYYCWVLIVAHVAVTGSWISCQTKPWLLDFNSRMFRNHSLRILTMGVELWFHICALLVPGCCEIIIKYSKSSTFLVPNMQITVENSSHGNTYNVYFSVPLKHFFLQNSNNYYKLYMYTVFQSAATATNYWLELTAGPTWA